MATSNVSGSISLDLLFSEAINDGGFKRGPVSASFQFGVVRLPNGTTVGKVNKVYAAHESGIGASATTSYDLQTVVDSIGGAIDLDECVLIAIRNNSDSLANVLTSGPNAVNGFGVLAASLGFVADASDRVVIPAKNSDQTGGSWLVLHCDVGIPVDATHKVWDVITASGSAANSWDILIVGRDTA